MQIAKETIKENNLSSELSNDPMQAIKLLLDNDGSKLQHIMSIVSSKLSAKLKDQGSNGDMLYDQAKQFGEKLIKNISGITACLVLKKCIARSSVNLRLLCQNPHHLPPQQRPSLMALQLQLSSLALSSAQRYLRK